MDVNGIENGPNMVGKDYFGGWVVKERGNYIFYPYGSKGFFTCETPNADWNKSLGCAKEALLAILERVNF